MPFEFSIYSIVLGNIAFISLILIIYAVSTPQKTELTYNFVLVLVCTFIWSFGYAIQIAATDIETINYLNYIEYIGILSLPPFVLFLAISITNRLKILYRPLFKVSLFIIPCLSYIFLLTNEAHKLFYQKMEYNTTEPFISPNLTYGPIFYFQVVYNYILIIAAVLLLIYTFLKTPRENLIFRRQLKINIFGSLFPIAGNIIRITRIIPSIAFIDLTPYLFIVWFILIAYAIFKMGFLDVIPIARDKIFDEIRVGLVILDREKFIVDANSIAQDIIITKNLHRRMIFDVLKHNRYIQDRQTVISNIKTSFTRIQLKQTSLEELQFVILYPNTIKKKTYNLIIFPIYDSKKITIIGYLLSFQDISASINLASSFEERTKIQKIIIQLLSHDIRNQINISNGYAEMSLKKTSDEEITKYMKVIMLKNQKTIQLMEGVLNYLKIEYKLHGETQQKICIVEVIKDIINQLRLEIDSKEINIIEEYISEEVFILANITFNSVIYNLLSNAIKFSPRTGTITIKISDIGKQWLVKIGNDGPKMENSLKEKLFEPFRGFGKERGTGLGLTIVKEVLQFFHGRIYIENGENTGTIFVFEIPKYKCFSNSIKEREMS